MTERAVSKSTGRIMSDVLFFVLVIVIWFLLQAVILPRLGVST